jgi:hypothetical protein
LTRGFSNVVEQCCGRVWALLWSSDRLPLAVRLVSITFTGEGVDVNLVRIGEDGADFDLYNCSQKLVRSGTGRRLPDRRCLGGSADSGLEPNMEGG